jgi:hypothetical protein
VGALVGAALAPAMPTSALAILFGVVLLQGVPGGFSLMFGACSSGPRSRASR